MSHRCYIPEIEDIYGSQLTEEQIKILAIPVDDINKCNTTIYDECNQLVVDWTDCLDGNCSYEQLMELSMQNTGTARFL